MSDSFLFDLPRLSYTGTYAASTPIDTAFRQQRLKAWQYVPVSPRRQETRRRPLTPVRQTDPESQKRIAAFLRYWNYICADRRPTAMGE